MPVSNVQTGSMEAGWSVRSRSSKSVFFRDELPSLQRRLIVIGTLHRALRQFHFGLRQFLVGNQTHEMRDAVESRTSLVVGNYDVPRRVFGIGSIEHAIARPGIFEPFAARGEVHRAELPLADGIVDARLEAALLFLVADFEPELDELDAAINQVPFHHRSEVEKPPVFLLRAETHHVLDAGAVVPTAIENHDLTSSWQVRHVPLEIDHRFLTVGRRRQRDRTKYARADTLGDSFDRPTLTRSIPSFENHDDAEPLVFDPFLNLTKAFLKLAQFIFIRLPFERRCAIGVFHTFLLT